MATRKTGSRPIVVDGIRYRWRIRHRATFLQADYGFGTLHVAVQLDEHPTTVLVLETDRPQAANDEARERFGYPVDLSDLPIPEDLRRELEAAYQRFDTSLDWDNPAGPSPWSKEESEEFGHLTDRLLDRLRVALGSEFEIRDERPDPAAG